MAKYNHDCFNCTRPDCDNDVLTNVEKIEATSRDRSYANYGKVIYGHSQRSRRKAMKH